MKGNLPFMGYFFAGKTIIFSTHNLELVARISDRAILFSEEHSVAADRPTAELIRDIPLLQSVNLIGSGNFI